ncbi:MAG TPA: SurA N-terminal domain-containing protein [Armatimonadota bacterium]|jgi:foldase protein PrsA
MRYLSFRTVFALTSTLFLAVALGVAPRPAQADPTDVVATVNGDKVTEAQLAAALRDRYGFVVREQLIESLVIEQEAKKKNLTVTEAEIDDAFAKSKAQVEARLRQSGQTWEMWLASQDLTVTALRRRLREQILLEKMVKPSVTVTDDDVSKYYAANRQSFALEEAMEVGFIALATKEDADKLRASLVGGTVTWDKAAKDSNLDPYGRENGGYLGMIVKGDQPLQKVAFQLAADGDISQPFEEKSMEPNSWILVKRISYQAAGTPPFEKVQDKIREMMTSARVAAAAQARLKALLEVADVKRLGDFKQPGQ